MLMRQCGICGKLHPVGVPCPYGQKIRYKTDGKNYDATKRNRNRAGFYHSRQWRRMRERVHASFMGLDAVSFVNGYVKLGETVHHIIPVADDPKRAMQFDNLILVSAETHNHIHELYKKSDEIKLKTEQELFKIREKFLSMRPEK